MINPFHPKYREKIHYDKYGFFTYWYQLNEIITRMQKKKGSILEIGVAYGAFTANYLKERNYTVVTLDIDSNLNPDQVGSVTDLPFKAESYELITCFEVLEHLPFKEFPKALSELYRVSKSLVIISVPEMTFFIKVNFQFMHYIIYKHIFSLNFLDRIRRSYPLNTEHYWEIGYKQYNLRRVSQAIQTSGFKIKTTYRIFENPYNRIFVLEK